MATLGMVRSGDAKTAASVIDRAISLNPNSAHAWMMKGFIHACLNQPKPALDALERAMRLSPLDPLGYFLAWCLGLPAFEEGQYERAIEWADRSLREEPTYLAALRIKVAACGLLGKPTEAHQALTQMLELHPAHDGELHGLRIEIQCAGSRNGRRRRAAQGRAARKMTASRRLAGTRHRSGLKCLFWVKVGCCRPVDGTAGLPSVPEMPCVSRRLRLVPKHKVAALQPAARGQEARGR
jgi:tetratricopeptide (TPR) repeat protein